MPPNLNNVPTQATYVAALTVTFPRGRAGFTVTVNTAAVFYQLAYFMPGDREPSWVLAENNLAAVFASFRDVEAEGLPAGSQFGGIRFRSLGTTPGIVSVA